MSATSKQTGLIYVRFPSQNTRRNLPPASSRKRTESNFLRSFERFYLNEDIRARVAGREFTVEGFGRADLVWLAWQSKDSAEEFTALALKMRARLTAIECKVSDWRKGLQQAFRYRYFSHRSLLVLPKSRAASAAKYLVTFKHLRIGLWGFDPIKGTVRKWFTPRSSAPLSRKAHDKALALFAGRLNFSQLTK